MIFFTLYVYINIKELTNYKKKCRTELNNNLIYLRKRRKREKERKKLTFHCSNESIFYPHFLSSLAYKRAFISDKRIVGEKKEGGKKRERRRAREEKNKLRDPRSVGRENKGREGNDVCKGNPFDDWKGTFDPLGLSPLLQRLETINHNGERAIFVSSPRASLLVETGLKRVPLFDEVSVESAPSFSPG